MKICRGLLILLVITTTPLILKGQTILDSLLLIPNVGIILNNKDTILFGETKQSIINKIDTSKFPCKIDNYFIVHGGGQYTEISFKNLLRFGFAGEKLTLIWVMHPMLARTINNLKIGSDTTELFKSFPRKEGSYNCGYTPLLWSYCYKESGIDFGVRPYKEPDPAMFQRIYGIVIYKSNQ